MKEKALIKQGSEVTAEKRRETIRRREEVKEERMWATRGEERGGQRGLR